MPKVSLHTAVKGQFGLGTGRAMGKALKVFILKMFIGRHYRKKRKVLLPVVPTPPKKPPMSWRPPVHDAPGIERNWYESCYRSHASSCGCGNFIAHLLILADRHGFAGGPAPPGGPRPGAIRALPAPDPERANPAAQPPWPGDAGAAGAGGPAAAGDGAAADDDLPAADIADLLDAVERDEQ